MSCRRLKTAVLIGVAQVAVLSCSAPLHAQMQGGFPVPQGSFNDRAIKPEEHVLRADEAPGGVQGVIRYSSGLPVAGAHVVILDANVDVERNAVSAEDGSYSFKNLKPGQYQLTAKLDGYAISDAIKVEVIPGKTVASDVSLPARNDLTLPASGGWSSKHASPTPQYRAQTASLHLDSDQPSTPPSSGTFADASQPAAASDSPAAAPAASAVNDELEAMRKRIDELETEMKAGTAPSASAEELESMKDRIDKLEAELKSTPAPAVAGAPSDTAVATATVATADTPAQGPAVSAPTEKPKKIDPFSDYDWTWLNGNPRTKAPAFDSAFFTPDIRADLTYTYDFNKPSDNSMGGSSELFRSNELQLEQLGLGGDFHWDNVRARFMTQFGMYSTATVRNDPSPAKGQWDIADADRYLAEAYGGYHLNVMHGINLDAGIFMSYIGLFSYYNFDNWAYQPSYVSSNTPWFFNGLRVQIFPTAHFKIEPWIINGWQSYGSSNSRHGLGGQIKWTPYAWLNIVSNEYGLGHDDLYIPNRARIHTDNSVEVKYYDHPDNLGLDKMAFSFTGDLGCEFGGGVSCYTDKSGGPKQSFIGYMIYDRYWFHKDLFGLTVGGGQINNPGRYLVLVPPINGETAASAALNSPYFTFNPGDPFKAWDSSVTFDYMPKQWITFRIEGDYRHADVPYWSGPGGVTPPAYLGSPTGTNNGVPTEYACMDGTPSLTTTGCGNDGGLWTPDLRKDEMLIDIDLMVKF